LLAAFAVLCLTTTAKADAVSDFYTGKRLTLITSASVGGGYDQYARLLARHMPRFIPGNPVITVQNMPGAEGIKAANHLYNIAAKDGTVLGGLQRNTGLAHFYAPETTSAQFDARKFTWLGSPQQEIGLLIVRASSGVKSAEDLKTKEITTSSTSRNSPSSIYPRLLNAIYGSKLKVIEGYDGSQSALLAIERGEVDAHISGGSSAAFRARFQPWEKSGMARVVLQLGMERDPEYKNVPTALEIAPTPADRRIFEMAFVEQVMGRPFVLPPGVPQDRVIALRKAFDATMTDKEFLDEARKQGMEIDPVSGARINELLEQVYSAPADVANRVRALVK
jgi:tripartite-type tricarboxylate transporter receptor subunit TctC